MSTEELSAALQTRIAEIKKKYEPQLESLTERGKKLQDDYERPSDIGAVVGVDFKIGWKDVEFSFDVPSVTVENRTLSMDLPEVTSSQQHIAFDVPDVRMVDRKTGQYPEIHGWTVVWKDIIVSVPEPYMRRVDIAFDIPSVTMRRREFTLGIPRITMERVRWVAGLPQITIINVSAKTQQIKDQGAQLQRDGEAIAQQMKQEINAEVEKFKGAMLAEAFSTKTSVSNNYNQALGTIKSAMDSLQRQGCDPIKVPTQNGDVNLRKIYDDVNSNKARALSEFDQLPGLTS